MAPEVAQHRQKALICQENMSKLTDGYDMRSDLFSLDVTMITLLTAKTPNVKYDTVYPLLAPEKCNQNCRLKLNSPVMSPFSVSPESNATQLTAC